MSNTISQRDVETAMRNGVFLIELLPPSKHTTHVTTIHIFGGHTFINGTKQWVENELKKMGVKFTKCAPVVNTSINMSKNYDGYICSSPSCNYQITCAQFYTAYPRTRCPRCDRCKISDFIGFNEKKMETTQSKNHEYDYYSCLHTTPFGDCDNVINRKEFIEAESDDRCGHCGEHLIKNFSGFNIK